MWGIGPMQSKLWDPTVLEQWSAAIATPSLRLAYMGMAGPHDMGTECIQQVLLESQKVWLAQARAREGLIKSRLGPGGTMVWAL